MTEVDFGQTIVFPNRLNNSPPFLSFFQAEQDKKKFQLRHSPQTTKSTTSFPNINSGSKGERKKCQTPIHHNFQTSGDELADLTSFFIRKKMQAN